ncbi:DedA family protein [Consotaella salsifontis]|uniref:Membrane protein DedA, SNARE-associated domain n=1 Tax=Consotaella salsifontis TaxID=1365950 RepID=A0A1T4P7C5_9HYPH|nr:DedA family protein [Consotaella salsifontis]SJZ87116.1 membrane protein DedA, SNARE-associated domain [Consotaella salsifontis]
MYQILALISQFGPLIVFAGTFVEGEVFAIIGGFLAYRNVYPFELMAALAFIGSFLGDLAVFLFARFFSGHRWVRRWKARRKFAKALRLVERYQAYFVIVNRYIYGLRVPGLIALGMSRITVVRFLLLNFVGAAIWAGLFTTIGYVFGYSIGSVFAHLEILERGVGITLGVIAVALTLWFAWRQWGPALIKRSRFPEGHSDGRPRLRFIPVMRRGKEPSPFSDD